MTKESILIYDPCVNFHHPHFTLKPIRIPLFPSLCAIPGAYRVYNKSNTFSATLPNSISNGAAPANLHRSFIAVPANSCLAAGRERRAPLDQTRRLPDLRPPVYPRRVRFRRQQLTRLSHYVTFGRFARRLLYRSAVTARGDMLLAMAGLFAGPGGGGDANEIKRDKGCLTHKLTRWHWK